MNAKSKNIVGKRVKEARRASKPRLTQIELVARVRIIGVPFDRTALSKIEHGTQSVSDIELVAFAKVLNVSILWLLGCDEKGVNKP
jgi:transcriptional regulator with XRE-family HTH domain